MNNVHFEEYYSKNGCVPKDEQAEFFDALRKPLPLSFRVTGSTSQAKQLIAQMEATHLSSIESLVLDNGKVVKPAEPLPWYPNRLAWKTNLSRQELRKFPQLSGFHQWMIAEGESGHVTRQELVSMIPTLLLDIKSHCAVLDMCAAPGSKTSQIIEALHADAEDDKFQKDSASPTTRITDVVTCSFIRRRGSTAPAAWSSITMRKECQI